MTERVDFIAAICAKPGCDTRRGAFADWLDEHDEPERAEFIRVQCGLANTDDSVPNCERYADQKGCDCDECKRYYRNWKPAQELRRRERELFENGYTHRWGFPKAFPSTPFAEDYAKGRGEMYGFITRGFVSHLTCTAELFLTHAPQLVWHPEMTNKCGDRCNIPPWCAKCRDINGLPTGRIPRPCPETAQPIVSVKLTTSPEPWSEWIKDGIVTGRHPDGRAKACKLQRFPGIVFELP